MLGASKNAYQSLIKLVDSNKNLHSFENGESILLLADAITGSKTLLTTLTIQEFHLKQEQVLLRMFWPRLVLMTQFH